MIAVDTNLVVRLVTRDDEEQAQRAARLFRSHRIFLGKAVLVETEWVLRYSYELDRSSIRRTFSKLLGFPQLTIEDRPNVLRALAWYGDGVDFADALHIASSGEADRFATFDRALVRASAQVGTAPPAEMP